MSQLEYIKPKRTWLELVNQLQYQEIIYSSRNRHYLWGSKIKLTTTLHAFGVGIVDKCTGMPAYEDTQRNTMSSVATSMSIVYRVYKYMRNTSAHTTMLSSENRK